MAGLSDFIVMNGTAMPLWWAMPKEKALEALESDGSTGLSAQQVAENRARYGTNVIMAIAVGESSELGMIALTIVITSVPAVYPILKTTSLPLYVWAAIVVITVTSTFWIEVKKMVLLIRSKPQRKT
jgi:hypothetical protein